MSAGTEAGDGDKLHVADLRAFPAYRSGDLYSFTLRPEQTDHLGRHHLAYLQRNLRVPGLLHMSAICVEMVGIPPSPNELRRMHWAERGKEMKSWREGSYKTALDLVNRLHWKTLDRAWVEIVITCREHNRRDPDNAIAAMKPLIDGLVDAGAIKDDSFDVIASLTIRQTFGKHDGVALWIKDEPPRL